MSHSFSVYVPSPKALTEGDEELSAKRGATQEVNTALQHRKPNLNKSARQPHCT